MARVASKTVSVLRTRRERPMGTHSRTEDGTFHWHLRRRASNQPLARDSGIYRGRKIGCGFNGSSLPVAYSEKRRGIQNIRSHNTVHFIKSFKMSKSAYLEHMISQTQSRIVASNDVSIRAGSSQTPTQPQPVPQKPDFTLPITQMVLAGALFYFFLTR